MPQALEWDAVGEKRFEVGTKKCAIYVTDTSGNYGNGVAWNGITGFTVSNTGGEETALWADDIKYASMRSAEECGGTIEAYQCPPEFYPCDGIAEVAPGMYVAQQSRRPFGATFVSTIGNDTQSLEFGYKIHILYNCTASPSERPYTTINESPDANTLSWEFKSNPVNISGYKPTAHIEIDSTRVNATNLANLEKILWGSSEADARLPLPNEVYSIISAA